MYEPQCSCNAWRELSEEMNCSRVLFETSQLVRSWCSDVLLWDGTQCSFGHRLKPRSSPGNLTRPAAITFINKQAHITLSTQESLTHTIWFSTRQHEELRGEMIEVSSPSTPSTPSTPSDGKAQSPDFFSRRMFNTGMSATSNKAKLC